MKKLIYLFLISLGFACETTLDTELGEAEEIMVVDAWINQKMERQEIRITRSQPYFDNSVPPKISGATVRVEDLNTGETYAFQEGPNSYYWDPTEKPFGQVGHRYRLTVTAEGETFEAIARLGRVPSVDTIKFRFKPEDMLISEPYYMAEFAAADPAGLGDAYWIKAWKNGSHLSKPAELNIAYDAGFAPGQSVDGELFNIAIRRDFVNPMDKNPEKDGELIPPWAVGDSLYVEIYSLDPLAFDFLYGAYFQINRGGFAELFSMPLANAITNLKSTREHSTTPVAGFFNVSAVSGRGQRLTQEIANAARQQAE